VEPWLDSRLPKRLRRKRSLVRAAQLELIDLAFGVERQEVDRRASVAKDEGLVLPPCERSLRKTVEENVRVAERQGLAADGIQVEIAGLDRFLRDVGWREPFGRNAISNVAENLIVNPILF